MGEIANSTILITGGCGYLGSELIRELARTCRKQNVTVRILDNMQHGRVDLLFDYPEGLHYEFIEGDVLDHSTVRMALQGVDKVVHLAAIVRTPLSFENPTWIEQINHWGTAQLIESILRQDVPPHLIFASTTAVYGPGGPFAEAEVCRPQGHYAQSKLHAEETIFSSLDRGLRTTILRFGQLYGIAPAIRFNSVANRLCYQAGTNRSVTIHGDGKQKRSLIHVSDAAKAVVHLLSSPPEPAESMLFNAVTDQYSILDLVNAIQGARPNVNVRFVEQDIRTHYSFEAQNDKLISSGWSPTVELENGIGQLLEKFEHFLN